MSKLFIEVNKLLIEGQSRVEIFTYRPENIDREALGYLFLLGEIELKGKPEPNDLFTLNSLASVLKREYYSTPYETPALNLEEALKSINTAFANIGSAHSPIEVHAVIAALDDEALHIAKHGQGEVFLVRDGRWLNISKAKSSVAKSRPRKKVLFSNILSGKVQAGDSLIFTTADFSPFLKDEKLCNRIIQQPFDEVASYIQKQINHQRDGLSVALLKLDVHARAAYENTVRNYDFTREAVTQNKSVPVPDPKTIKQSSPLNPKPLKGRLVKSLANFKHWSSTFKAIRQKSQKLTQNMALRFSKTPALGFLPIKKLRKVSKSRRWAIAGVAGVGLLVLSFGLVHQITNQNSKALINEQLSKYQAEFTAIKQLGLSSTIADWQSLQNTLAVLASNPATMAQATLFQSQVSALRQELTGTEQLKEIMPLITFKNLAVKIEPLGILNLGDTVGVFSADSFLRQSLTRIEAPRFTPLPQKIAESLGVVNENNNKNEFIFLNKSLLTQSAVFSLETGNLEPLALRKIDDNAVATDAFWYTGRLYVLDAPAQQVLRYDLTKPLLPPKAWLTPASQQKLGGAHALAVDGNIYVGLTDTNGSGLLRFSNGTITKEWRFEPADISAIAKIALSQDQIFLLDGALGKILAIDKQSGAIKQRLGHEALLNAFDLIVESPSSLITLTPKGVYRINLDAMPTQP